MQELYTKLREAVMITEGYQLLNLEKRNKRVSFRAKAENTYMIVSVPCSCGSTTDYMFSVPNEDLNNEELTVEQLAEKIVRRS
jgi:uncharacterized membrane protein